MIKMIETTPRVVSRREESIPSNAPNRSPSSAPIPVTLEVSPTLFANSAESSRSVSITSGRAGLLFGGDNDGVARGRPQGGRGQVTGSLTLVLVEKALDFSGYACRH